MTGRYPGKQRLHSWRSRARLSVLAAVLTAAMTALGAAGARAADQVVITSAGPMTDIYVNNDLSCQVSMLGDVAPTAFFGPIDPGSCGTSMEIDALGAAVASGAPELFAPPVSNGFIGGGVAQAIPDFTPVSQTVTGTGTATSPYTATSMIQACAPETGTITLPVTGACPTGDIELAALTETDTYVVGSDEYDTTLQITNEYAAALSGTLYHTGDCSLEQDSGYGALGGTGANAPECTINAGNTPAGRIMSFVPGAGPSGASYGYLEGAYPTFWQDITSAGNLYPDTVATGFDDNGMGVSWRYSVPVAGAETISYATVVDPAPPSVAMHATSLGAGSASFSAVVNPDGAPASVFFEYGLDPKYGLTTTSNLYVVPTPVQPVASGLSPVPVTATVTGLVPGALYHVRVVAASADGTTLGTDNTFTTAALAPPPPPTLGQAANFTPVSGTVYVKPPHGTTGAFEKNAAGATKGQGFIPLTQARQLPVGTEVDARLGKLRLTTATSKTRKHKRTKTQSGLFFGGLFEVGQSKSQALKGLTTLRLLDNGAFPGAPSYSECSTGTQHGHARAHAIAVTAKKKPKLSKKVLQTLGENEHGNYSTQGKYSAATVRGTDFSVSDRCDGTLTHVYHGIVVVTVFRTHKHQTLRTNQSYLAPAP